ncbi:MAG: MarC family protein [Pseudomonadota bacterium]
MEWNLILKEFIALWVVIDPIGSIPIFIAVTVGLSDTERYTVAIKAIAFAALILMFFLVAGQMILNALQIHLEAFQIAGGIVLFLFALTMIFGDSKIDDEKKQISGNASHLAVFPLAVPSLASPGAMLAVVMLTDNHRHTISQQFFTAGAMLSVLLVTLLLFFAARPIQHILGDSGASLVSRVMGLILSSVAVDNVLSGVTSYFNLA